MSFVKSKIISAVTDVIVPIIGAMIFYYFNCTVGNEPINCFVVLTIVRKGYYMCDLLRKYIGSLLIAELVK